MKFNQIINNIILPDHCACCNKTGRLLCQKCYQLIHFNPTPHINSLFQQNYLDKTMILATYQPPISDLIRELKYKRVKKISEELAQLLFLHLNIAQHNLITWAPTSKKRVNVRGFNQAQLIAQHLGRKLLIQSLPLLLKTKHTSKQAQSSFQERLNNLKNSFYINNRTHHLILEKKVLIVDDVISTGSTLNECARILKQAGAKTVTAIAIAQS